MKLSPLSYCIALLGMQCVTLPITMAKTVTTNAETQIIAVNSEHKSAQFQQLRQRWTDYFLGDPTQVFDQGLNDVVYDINQQAKKLLTTQDLTISGLWPDLILDDKSGAGQRKLGADLYSSYKRLFTLARAYKLPGGALYNNSELRDDLIASLTLLNERFYHDGAPEYGNWWHWELGISRTSNNILVILYDELPAALIAKYVEASRHFVPRPTHLSEGTGAPYSSTAFMFKSTGGNRTDNAQVVLIRALLDNNTAEIKAAVNALSTVLPLVETGDGFYADGSFIQHKDLPYSGTYGQVMLEGLGMLLGLVANTPYQATDPALAQIYPILIKSFAPLLVDGQMLDFVNGRAVSRVSGQNHKIGHNILSAMLLYVPGAPAEYKQALSSIIKTNIVNDTYANYFTQPKVLSSYQLAVQIVADPSIPVLPRTATHTQYPEMDRIVHKRPAWTFGIAMHSDRVGNYECINGENLKGWHSADGMTYLYTNQLDHYSNFWPLVDAYKLPGTTSLTSKRDSCSGQLSAQRDGRNNNIDWVGGSQLGAFGVAGMNFSNWNNNLSAKKSWFMFDDQVVALGADIRNDDDADAVTTIANRKLTATAQVSVNGAPLVDGQSFNGELTQLQISYPQLKSNINYMMLTPQTAQIDRQCVTGNWADIGNDEKTVSGCFVSASLPHGKSQVSSYAYSILPNASAEKVNQYTEAPNVHILANNGQVQAIENNRLNLIAANFWEDAEIAEIGLSADDPLSIMIDKSAAQWRIAISDPTRAWFESVSFSLTGQFSISDDTGKRVELSKGNTFTVNLDQLNGSSYQFSITPMTQQ